MNWKILKLCGLAAILGLCLSSYVEYFGTARDCQTVFNKYERVELNMTPLGPQGTCVLFKDFKGEDVTIPHEKIIHKFMNK